MLPTKSLPFLPGRRALRRHYANLQARLSAEPAVRLLPGLMSLPLGGEPLPDPAALLALHTSIALSGPPAGGRTLALLQTAARWAEYGAGGLALYLPLAEADLPNLSPRAVVAGAAHSAGLSQDFAEGQRPGLLLLDDWELLPADRRALWKSFLCAGAAQWPALRAVIALPQGDAWPGLRPVTLAEPQPATLLAHLLPDQDLGPVLAALGAEPLIELRGRLADLILLALTYPLGGIPASRAQLYEHAYALVRPLLAEGGADSGAPQAAGPAASILIGRALLRHYRLARALAGGDDLATLADLSAAERAAVAPLAAGLLDDPTPVLASLWASGDDIASLRALTACAREAPARAPLLGLRLVERLALPAPDDRPQTTDDRAALLAELAPALPALLAAAGRLDEPRSIEALRAVHAAMPGAQALWLQLCDDLGAPAGLRWAAADRLAAARLDAALLSAAPAGSPPKALVPRAYLAALAGPAARAALAGGPLGQALAALLEEPDLNARRAVVAQALIDDQGLPEDLRALALRSAGSGALVERAAGSGSAALRQAALAALSAGEPGAALSALGRSLARPDAASEGRREILDTIAAMPGQGAVAELSRAVLNGRLPLSVRLHAGDLLAPRGPAGAHILRRLLVTAGLPVSLRAAAAGHLGRLGVAGALPDLAATLALPGEPLLRRAAAVALAALAQRPGLRDQTAAALVAGLRRGAIDTVLGERIIRALGVTGAPSALATLAGLLDPGLARLLEAAWLRVAPDLGRTPAFAWPALSLPAPARLALLDTLADGGTMADPPSRVVELAARQAVRLAIAASHALADLAARDELRAAAVAALRRAVVGEERAEVARAAIAALGSISEPAATLAAILDDPRAGSNLRWLAIESLGCGPEALELLRRRLERATDDPFVQAMAIEALGAAGYAPALPTLRGIARGASRDPHLRRAAITALGRLADPEAATALATLAAGQEVSSELRTVAAAALPARLAPAERVTLRQALRGERLPPELSAALARALARAGDLEVLPYLVRSAQGDTGAEAVASIEAIADLGDPSAAPLLVRLSQSPLAAPGVRLAAVSALLRLGGDEYMALLREYLAAPSPPLRIQAHAALAAARPDDPRLGAPIVEPGAPLALRLQALGHLAAYDPDSPVISAAVAAPDEQPQVRLAAAAILARSRRPGSVASLAAVLAPPEPEVEPAPPILRHHCALTIGVIARRAGPAAEAARDCLAGIAVDPDQAAEHRHWVGEALLGC